MGVQGGWVVESPRVFRVPQGCLGFLGEPFLEPIELWFQPWLQPDPKRIDWIQPNGFPDLETHLQSWPQNKMSLSGPRPHSFQLGKKTDPDRLHRPHSFQLRDRSKQLDSDCSAEVGIYFAFCCVKAVLLIAMCAMSLFLWGSPAAGGTDAAFTR